MIQAQSSIQENQAVSGGGSLLSGNNLLCQDSENKGNSIDKTHMYRVGEVDNNPNPRLLSLNVQTDVDPEGSISVCRSLAGEVQARFGEGESFHQIPIYLNNSAQHTEVEIPSDEDGVSFFLVINGHFRDQNGYKHNFGYATDIPGKINCLEPPDIAICNKFSVDPTIFF